MNFSPLRGFSPYDHSSTKPNFPLQEDSLHSSSLTSFSNNIIPPHHLNISNGNQTYNIRKLKSLVSSCQILQSPFYDKVVSALDFISNDLSDSSLPDFCDFLSCCYKVIPQEIISRIISVFQKLQFSTNTLILISYLIRDFQDNPYDDNSTQFFQSFINNSYVQLRKELLSTTSNNTTSDNFLPNNIFHNYEKFRNFFSICIVDSQNTDTYFNEEEDFEISNVDDNSIFMNNQNYNNVIIYENDENNNKKSNNNNSNSNNRFNQNDPQNFSFFNTNSANNEANTNNNNLSRNQEYKLFNCTFTHEQILKFLLYFLRSKEMRETNAMSNSWADFIQIIMSQYENQVEIAQFADYMISFGKINMIPREMYMNTYFIEIADKNSIIEVIKILSAQDIKNNELMIGLMIYRFPDSDFIVLFLKKCQELDYTLSQSFLNEIVLTRNNFISAERNSEGLDFSNIVNTINPNEFNGSFLSYLVRYKFKFNSTISTKISPLLGKWINDYPNISFECLVRIIDSPLKVIDYKYFIPYLYTCNDIDVFNSITNNYPHKQDNEIIIHPVFKDPKFWSKLISLFEFNSIQHFTKIFIMNNSDNKCGSLVAKIFLDDFPKNMKSSFYFFAKSVLKGHFDSFSTCKETKELLSRFDRFYPRQFWRLFTKTNLIIELARSSQATSLYNYYHHIISLSLVQILLADSNGVILQDPMIKSFNLPSPLTSNQIEEIISFFNINDNFFKIDNTSNETVQILSIGHYFYSVLLLRFTPFNIIGYNPLYCLIIYIIILHDIKNFRSILFSQFKKNFNAFLNTTRNANMLKQAFEMDFPGKDQLIDIFISSFGQNDDDNYILCISDNDLKWVRLIFEDNSFLATNLAFSNSLSYFFGQLTLCVNAFNCPITNKFIISKLDYLFQLFYTYPCPFFTINNDILEEFIYKKIVNENISFPLINFIISSISRLSHTFTFPDFDLQAVASPFIKQNQISDISIIFDFCRLYMSPEKSVNLLKSPKLPNISKVSHKWIFKFLSNNDFREIYTIDCIKSLVHSADFSLFDGIIRVVEGILDDDQTMSNRCTFLAQMKKKSFSVCDNFQFPSRLALYNKNFLSGLYRIYDDSYADFQNHALIERINLIPLNSNSEYTIKFINELILDAIQTNSWQMFYVLKCIANSHLFLFTTDSFNLIEIFKYIVNSISSLNFNNFNDSFKLFLSCHTFLSFLLLSPCIADSFFNWAFSQLNEFNINELFLILNFIANYLNDSMTNIQTLAYCIKYDFITLLIKRLQTLKFVQEKEATAKAPPTPVPEAKTLNNNNSISSQTHVQRDNTNYYFNDHILYIDYDLFSDTDNDNDSDDNGDNYLNTIHLDHEINENERSSFNQNTNTTNDTKITTSENDDELNNEGINKCAILIKKAVFWIGMTIIKNIENHLSSLLSRTNLMKFIELDEILKNTIPCPIYQGNYNQGLELPTFKPFSNSFPRDIAIPNFHPKLFTNTLAELNSTLVNIDFVNNIIKNKLICEIDSDEMTIQINQLRNPYERIMVNLSAPIDPSNTIFNDSYNKWTNGAPLLKDIISIDSDEYDFMDEGGQAAVLIQKLPPLQNINDLNIQKFLITMPKFMKVILSNSQERVILPPHYIIELHRVIFLINHLNMKKNPNANDDINPTKLVYDQQNSDTLIELKINLTTSLYKDKVFTPIRNLKRFCSILFSIASIHNEEFVKKVFSIGNKYISANSRTSEIIGVLSIFESLKVSQFFTASFSALSALNVYEFFGRYHISNPEITVLVCSLFSALGNSITDFGVQIFEISLEMKDPKVYECLGYVTQLPNKVKQKLLKNVCNLIDNENLINDLNNSLIEMENKKNDNNDKDNTNRENISNALSMIEKVVKNFPPIVKLRSSKFIEILSFILSKGKYLPIVAMIAKILCSVKSMQSNGMTLTTMPCSSSSLAASTIPGPIITNTSSASRQRTTQPAEQPNNQKNKLFSVSFDCQEEDDYILVFNVPNHVYKTYPEFWKVIGPNMGIFNAMIEKEVKLLWHELSFLRDYPDVLSFNGKLLFFHKMQCIQQVEQQQRLQREYRNRGGILSFNSVIMTINNPNTPTNGNTNNGGNRTPSTNSISFINSASLMNNNRSNQGQARRMPNRANSSFVSSLVNESRSQPRFIAPQPPPQVTPTNGRSRGRISARPATLSVSAISSISINNNNINPNNNNNNNDIDDSSNSGGINSGIIRPMIKVRRSHILQDTYHVFGPAFSEYGFSIMPIRDIFVRFIGESGIDLGGLTKEWITSTIKELFNQDYGLFKQTTDNLSLFPNAYSSVNPDHLGYFELAGRIIAIALAKDINIDVHLAQPFLKSLLNRRLLINDLEKIDNQIYNSLKWISSNDNVEDLDLYFVVDVEKSLGVKETIELVKNGRNIKVTDENKNFFIELMADYYILSSVDAQVTAFKKGFYSIIPPHHMRMFTPNELDLLISGTNFIDVEDMRQNCAFEKPYSKNHPVIKLFFNCISKWDQDELHRLLKFITGLTHVPVGGFASLAQKKKPITITTGGLRDRLPQAHTCFNRIDIPAYQSEKELNEKLHLAIHECDNFLLI